MILHGGGAGNGEDGEHRSISRKMKSIEEQFTHIHTRTHTQTHYTHSLFPPPPPHPPTHPCPGEDEEHRGAVRKIPRAHPQRTPHVDACGMECVGVWVDVWVGVGVWVWVCTHTHTRVYTHTPTHTHGCVRVCVHRHSHTHTHTHTRGKVGDHVEDFKLHTAHLNPKP